MDENDQAILQSMMGSNLVDNRDLYRALPPQIVGAGLGERVMVGMPNPNASAEEQQYADRYQRIAEKRELEADPIAPPNEGAGPRPISPQLMQAMAAALKPNLSQFQRPLTLGAKITRQANELIRQNELDQEHMATTKKRFDLGEEEEQETVNPDGTISRGIRRR